MYSQQALDFSVRGIFPYCIHVVLVDTEFLGGKTDIERPERDIAPARVVLAHQRGEGFLRDDLVQDQVLVPVRPVGDAPGRGEALVGERVATVGVIRLQSLIYVGEGDGCIRHSVGGKIIGYVLLQGGALGNADGRPVQVPERPYPGIPAYHKPLPGVQVDPGVIKAQGYVADEGPGGAVRKNIYLAGLQQGENSMRGHGDVFDPDLTEYGGRYGLAMVDIKPDPLP